MKKKVKRKKQAKPKSGRKPEWLKLVEKASRALERAKARA